MDGIGRELLILGMVRRASMSAYDLNRAVREHAPLYRPLKGTTYHSVRKLSERGLLLRKSIKAQRGPAQTKSSFQLSAAGERRFQALLKQTILDIQATDAALEIAYVLLGQLSRAAALTLLKERAREIANQERRLVRLYGKLEERIGAGYIAVSHAAGRLRGERVFLKHTIGLLQDPTWTRDWLSGLRAGKERSVEGNMPER